MCRQYETRYYWCGHIKCETRACGSLENDLELHRHTAQEQWTFSFCPECWSNPSVLFRDAIRHVPPRPLTGAIVASLVDLFQRVENAGHLFPLEDFPQFTGATAEDKDWLSDLRSDMQTALKFCLLNTKLPQPTPRERQIIAGLLRAEAELWIATCEWRSAHPPSTHGLTRADVLLRPIQLSEIEEDTECSICKAEIGKPQLDSETLECEKAVQLPCGHVFGEDCITAWLNDANNGCPYCRQTFGSMRMYDNLRPVQPEPPSAGLEPWWMRLFKGELADTDLAQVDDHNETASASVVE